MARTTASRVLALDVGTSSCRAALYDQRGQRLPDTLAQECYPLRTDAAGRAELDPETLLAALRRCVRAWVRPDTVLDAVAMSCFWHSLIGVDGDGRALTPIITWADSRGRDDAAKLRVNHAENAWHARTGCMQRASFWPAKLAWLQRTQLRTWRQVRYWLSPADWLTLHLTGVSITRLSSSHSMASATGLYHTARRDWDDELLRHVGVRRAQLLPISDDSLITKDGISWLPAIGDGAANNVGVGATTPGIAALNVGTSAAIRVVRRRGATPLGLFNYRIDAQRLLLGGAISNAGGLRAWCVEHLRLPDDAGCEQFLAAHPGPAERLIVLPFWLAERAPSWRDDLRGTITGISQSTTALDLLHAITEATYQCLATVAALLPKTTQTIVGGGIQRSPASVQRLAEVLNRPLTVCDETEPSLRGAAVFALERLGCSVAPVTGSTVQPRARFAAAYAAQRRSLAALERRLDPLRPEPR